MQQNRKGKNLLMISCVKKQLTLWMKCLGNKIFNCTSLYGCIRGSQLLAPWQAYLYKHWQVWAPVFSWVCNGFLKKSSQFTKFSTINNWSTCWYCLPLSKWYINTEVMFFAYHLISFFHLGFVMPGCIVLEYWSHKALSLTHLSLLSDVINHTVIIFLSYLPGSSWLVHVICLCMKLCTMTMCKR